MQSRQLIAFKLNGREYGAYISHIREIRPYSEVVRILLDLNCIEGFIDIRGCSKYWKEKNQYTGYEAYR
jgi:chemotaxis signal transduction protein